MKITLKKLQVFVLTAENNSLTQATQQCYISHSAASQALMELEGIFGQLFDRIGKRLRLNNNGKQFYPKAREILDRAHELEAMTVSHKIGYLQGNLSIGASSTIGNYWLPKYLAEFKQYHPKITINLVMGNTKQIIEGSNQLIFDFAFIENAYAENNMVVQPWIKDRLVIVCNNSNPLAHQSGVTLYDLKNQYWAIRESGSGTRDIMISFLKEHFSPQIEIELPTTETIKNYLLKSQCLALLSYNSVENELKQKIFKIIKIKPLSIKRYFYFIRHTNKYQSLPAQRLQAFLKGIMK